METIIHQIMQCHHCENQLPFAPKPIVQLSSCAKILIIGQAPGLKAHQSGIAFDDQSGDRLRQWLSLSRAEFYDLNKVAIMPMGFCYPGKGKTGDLAPIKACYHQWHAQILKHMTQVEVTFLVGLYAQKAYLDDMPATLTQTVQSWQQWAPSYIPLPHPSPRNRFWLKNNPWFEKEMLPLVQQRIHSYI